MFQFSSVQPLSSVRLFETPWIAAHQASLSITNSWSLLKLMSVDSGMPSNHLILCGPFLLPPSIFPSIRVFSNESVCFHLFFFRGKRLALFFFSFIFTSWRLITLQYCSGFCHTLIWISHGFTSIPHPDPPSHLPLHPIPLGLPSAPGPSTCLMHPTWAGDLFHTW